MKRAFLYRLCFVMSAALFVWFGAALTADAVRYSSILYSVPFYMTAMTRVLLLLAPSLALLLAGVLLRGGYKAGIRLSAGFCAALGAAFLALLVHDMIEYDFVSALAVSSPFAVMLIISAAFLAAFSARSRKDARLDERS